MTIKKLKVSYYILYNSNNLNDIVSNMFLYYLTAIPFDN